MNRNKDVKKLKKDENGVKICIWKIFTEKEDDDVWDWKDVKKNIEKKKI